MLDLATLKATLQPIRQIGEVEERFNIQGTQVCMRVLNPKEELEIQRWAQSNIMAATTEDQEKDNSLAVEYLNRFKLGCLSYSLVEINGLDLRAQEYVATGEVLQNGQAVKVKRTDAIREMLETWPRPLLSAVFRKFNEIMERCEIQSDKSVEFNPPSIDAEIQRLLQRLQTLEEMKEGKENAALAAGEIPTDAPVVPHNKTGEDQTTVVEDNQPTPSATQTERVSAIPTSGAAVAPQAPIEEPTPTTTSTQPPTEGKITTASGAVGTAAPNDGWVDKGDQDSMEAAVAAENARLMQMRANRTAPHHAAKEVADAIQSERTPPNVDVAEAEVAEITGRHPEPTVEPAETSTNPRFTPPKKR